MTYQGFSVRKNEEICSRILHSHLTYLNQEETPAKLKQRLVLEKLILEFLSLVPHDEKFSFPEIETILKHSVAKNKNFSAYKAALAFEALEKYATNLLSHPWRKEYRIIKIYNGFYRHSVEGQLLEGINIFLLLGYKEHEDGILYLDEPVDPDRVTKVALDCLKACTECQIMLQICEELNKNYKCFWPEILNVREQYVCGVGEAVRILQQLKKVPTYKCQQDDILSGSLENGRHDYYTQHNVSDACSLSNNIKYNMYATSHGVTTTQSHSLTTLQSSPVFSMHHLKPNKTDSYFPNVTSWASNDMSARIAFSHPESISYPFDDESPDDLSPYEERANVLDPTRNSKHKSSLSKTHTRMSSSEPEKSHLLLTSNLPTNLQPALCPEPVSYSKPPAKLIDTSYPNYKFQQPIFSDQYSSLASSRLHHLLHDAGAVDSSLMFNSPNTSPSRERSQLNQMHSNSDKMSDLLPDTSHLKRSQQERKTKEHLQRPSFYDNVPTDFESPTDPNRGEDEEEDLINNFGNCYISAPVGFGDYSKKSKLDDDVPPLIHLPNKSDPPSSSITMTNESLVSVSSSSKPQRFLDMLPSKVWSCSSCTFRNSKDKKVCDMCGRSKFPGAECTPLLSGGQECSQCTLVNKKDATNCTACGSSLKDSPTYI